MPEAISLKTLTERFPCRLLTGPADSREISGGYACDLLSWVIAHVKEGDVWMTILNSINVVAVATLADCACVMLTEGVRMDDQVLARAREKNIIILATDLPTWEASVTLSDLLRG